MLFLLLSKVDARYVLQISENEDSDNGTITLATCECPMDQFRCHNIAAALLFRASRTNVKCSWIKHPKSAPPKTTTTIGEMYPPRKQEYSYALDFIE
ncbi:uncharacterized protein LOC111099877 isoform X3 [Crassostrea virginica]